jgi:Ser/Thr protein kinase RdoA (MazF antagonist)
MCSLYCINSCLSLVSPLLRSVVGLIDFNDAVYTFTVNEIAIALAYTLTSEYGQSQPYVALGAMFSGYVLRRQLSDVELEVLPIIIATRLCISISVGAFSISKEPENEYLTIFAKPARRALQFLWCIDVLKWTEFYRDIQCSSVLRLSPSEGNVFLSENKLREIAYKHGFVV